MGINNSFILNELSFQDTSVPVYKLYFSYTVIVLLASGGVKQPHLNRQPIPGDQVPTYNFYNRPFSPFQVETMEFITGKKINKLFYAIFSGHFMESVWELCSSNRRSYLQSVRQCLHRNFVLGIKKQNRTCLHLCTAYL